MSEEIYSGETATLILRCRDAKGEPLDMAGMRADVVMTGRRGNILIHFSTSDPALRPVETMGNYLLCRLSSDDMARLRGLNLVEIRINRGGMVSIAQLPGVRVLDSITGKLNP